jgi:hypothetical protein
MGDISTIIIAQIPINIQRAFKKKGSGGTFGWAFENAETRKHASV